MLDLIYLDFPKGLTKFFTECKNTSKTKCANVQKSSQQCAVKVMNKIIIFCYVDKAGEFRYLMFEVVFIIYVHYIYQ